MKREATRQNVIAAIQELHEQYMNDLADVRRDVQYILQATALLMAGCRQEYSIG